VKNYRLVSKQAGGEQWQRSVLVARRLDDTVERTSACYHELIHREMALA
jgi:hypothetical protein